MSAKRKSENPTLEEKICIVLKDLRSFSDFWSKLYEASECSLRRCHVGKFAAKPERFVNKKEPFEKVTFVDLCHDYPDSFETMFSFSQRKNYYLNYSNSIKK